VREGIKSPHPKAIIANGYNKAIHYLTGRKNMLKKIFSMRNEGDHKVITVFGIKVRLKRSMRSILATLRKTVALKPHLDHNDLSMYMLWVAGEQSAQYIIDNMLCAEAYENSFCLLKAASEKVENREGCYLEFGVFSGRSINWIASHNPDKTVYGFDSFEGLPEDWMLHFKAKVFAVNSLPPVEKNVKLIKGWFNETLPGFVASLNDDVAFLHVDCDLYSSTKTIFECLGDKIKSGTIIVFDEYFNYPGWQRGEFKAFQEFVQERNLKYEYIGYVVTHQQVAVKII